MGRAGWEVRAPAVGWIASLVLSWWVCCDRSSPCRGTSLLEFWWHPCVDVRLSSFSAARAAVQRHRLVLEIEEQSERQS